jgi:hypothetical protein
VTFKIWEMLKDALQVTLIPKKILKNFELCASFVESKESLADGTLVTGGSPCQTTSSHQF